MQKAVFDLSEEDCLEILEKNRWKEGISCPLLKKTIDEMYVTVGCKSKKKTEC